MAIAFDRSEYAGSSLSPDKLDLILSTLEEISDADDFELLARNQDIDVSLWSRLPEDVKRGHLANFEDGYCMASLRTLGDCLNELQEGNPKDAELQGKIVEAQSKLISCSQRFHDELSGDVEESIGGRENIHDTEGGVHVSLSESEEKLLSILKASNQTYLDYMKAILGSAAVVELLAIPDDFVKKWKDTVDIRAVVKRNEESTDLSKIKVDETVGLFSNLNSSIIQRLNIVNTKTTDQKQQDAIGLAKQNLEESSDAFAKMVNQKHHEMLSGNIDSIRIPKDNETNSYSPDGTVSAIFKVPLVRSFLELVRAGALFYAAVTLSGWGAEYSLVASMVAPFTGIVVGGFMSQLGINALTGKPKPEWYQNLKSKNQERKQKKASAQEDTGNSVGEASKAELAKVEDAPTPLDQTEEDDKVNA